MKDRYIRSGRHEKREVLRNYVVCPTCTDYMFTLSAATTRTQKEYSSNGNFQSTKAIRFPTKIKYCPKCKIIKILSKEIKIAN